MPAEPLCSRRQQHRELRLLAALAAATLLSGCAAFSPDGGMDVVGDIAQHEIGKDVVAIRSAEDADAVRGAGACCSDVDRRCAPCRSRCSTIAACRRPTTSSAIAEADDGAGEPAAQSRRFSLDAHRRRRASSRSSGGSSPISLRSRRCRRAPRSRPTASARRSCAPPRRRCASRSRRAAPSTARSRRASWRAFWRRRKRRPKPPTQLARAPRRDRRDEQARSGARSGVLRRDHGAARDRAPARRQRARAPGPRARPVGRRSRLSGCRRAAAAAAPRRGRWPRSRPRRCGAASICRSRGSRSMRWPSPMA